MYVGLGQWWQQDPPDVDGITVYINQKSESLFDKQTPKKASRFSSSAFHVLDIAAEAPYL